jgi:hypothetical protein
MSNRLAAAGSIPSVVFEIQRTGIGLVASSSWSQAFWPTIGPVFGRKKEPGWKMSSA